MTRNVLQEEGQEEEETRGNPLEEERIKEKEVPKQRISLTRRCVVPAIGKESNN